MRGQSGTFRVTTPENLLIEQDMSAQPHRGDVLLIGSNPRYAGLKATWYLADSFRLTELSNGDWTIADTCDAQSCSRVYVEEASTF
jgi:hypothetical protein